MQVRVVCAWRVSCVLIGGVGREYRGVNEVPWGTLTLTPLPSLLLLSQVSFLCVHLDSARPSLLPLAALRCPLG